MFDKNKTTNRLSPQIIEHKQDLYIWRLKFKSWFGTETKRNVARFDCTNCNNMFWTLIDYLVIIENRSYQGL